MTIAETIGMFGTAQVLVSLKETKGSTASLSTSAVKSIQSSLSACFASASMSRAYAVAANVGIAKPKKAMKIYPNLGLALGTVDAESYRKLKSNAAVDKVHELSDLSLIRPVESAAAAAVPQGLTWGLKKMNIDKLWEKGFRGNGILIGHLDTGIDGTHPGLQSAIQIFEEFDGTGEIVSNSTVRDSGIHGTHTAGTIAGRPVNGAEYGVAPDALLAGGLVIEGGDIIRRILAGMDWAIGNNVRILSMSLGVRGFKDSFLPLMQAIRNRGILPVIAVGNEGPSTSRSPGNYDEVLSVGATSQSDEVASFSSSQKVLQPKARIVPDIVAPGVGILSCDVGGGFRMDSGSSMATPHVTGLAALLWQVKPDATVDQIEQAIFTSCQRPSTMGEDRGNRGIPDAVRAFDALMASAAAAVSAVVPMGMPVKKAAKKAAKKKAAPKKATKKAAKKAAKKSSKKKP